MPIVEQIKDPGEPCYDPGQGPVPEGAVKIETEVFRGITIDKEYAPPSNLMQWTSGSNWIVDYWSQILKPDQEPTPQNVAREPHAQQYRWLKRIPLKVNQTLSGDSDEILNVWTRTGSGHTYGFMTPNQGDMFAAGIGNGHTGLFTITSAKRVTIQKGSTYAIEWKQVSELTEERYNDLKRKSNEEYWFSAASASAGCGPFITNEEQARSTMYGKLLRTLVDRYITDFFSKEHSTFLVPDQLYKTYDHWVTKAFISMVDTTMDGRMRKVKVLNVMSEPVMSQPTVWDAIVRQDMDKITDSTERCQLVNTRISRWRPELQAIGYSGIPRFVFPMEAPTDVDSQYDGEDTARPWGIPFHEGRPRRPLPGPPQTQLDRDLEWFRRVKPEDEKNYSNQMYRIPADIHPVVRDNYYVFTESFYRCDAHLQSKLEMLTTTMIKGEELDKNQFDAMLENIRYWDNLERFYYYPVVIALLKYAM
ncbi:hypothetical protein D3C87_1001140 [compost metagenome]